MRSKGKKVHEVAMLLHNIRSAHNVGSIFRTADAAGVSRLVLTGYSPTPLDRLGRPRVDVAKVALGAESSVPWSYVKDVSAALMQLKEEEFSIVAVEQHISAKDYRTFQLKQPTCFVFGNEVRGLSKTLLEKCDEIVEIPMRGEKESLNVSVAVGIVLFHTL